MSHSPVDDEQFIIVLRTHEHVHQYPLAGWFTPDIPKLSKKFVTKKIALGANLNPDSYHIKFNKTLLELNEQENLNLIGGFQEGSNLHLLFFKVDKKPT